MPRPRKTSDDCLLECQKVAAQRYLTPTDDELAAKHGVSASLIQKLIHRYKEQITAKTDIDIPAGLENS